MVRVENVCFFGGFFQKFFFFKNRGGHVGGGGVTKNRTVQGRGGVATGNREGKLYMQK